MRPCPPAGWRPAGAARPATPAGRPRPRRPHKPAPCRPRALSLPPAEDGLPLRARKYARRLAGMRHETLPQHLEVWQARACEALDDYAFAEYGLRALAPAGGERARMGFIQRSVRAAGEVRGVVEELPAAAQPFMEELQPFLLALRERHTLLAGYLGEPDPGWQLGRWGRGVASPLATTLAAAHSWQPPRDLARPLGRLSALLALQHDLAGRRERLPAIVRGLRQPLLVGQICLLQLERSTLGEAQALLDHDGRLARGRAVFLWRRELGVLAEGLVAALDAEARDLPLRRHRLGLDLAWEASCGWLQASFEALGRALGRCGPAQNG